MSKSKRKTKVKENVSSVLTAELNEFAARTENLPPTTLQTAETPAESPTAAENAKNGSGEDQEYQKEISRAVEDLFDGYENREFHPLEFKTHIPIDSIEASVGYSSLIRQMHKAFVRHVAYLRSEAGGCLSIEEARARAFHPCKDKKEALKEFDTLMSLPLECLSFIDLQNLYGSAPRAAEGFWEIAKIEGRAEFESGHLAANITFPEDYMKQVWNIARYLGVRESFLDDWQPKGGIEVAMIDMMAQSYFQWQYWLEQTVRRSETRPREEHHAYREWKRHQTELSKMKSWDSGYWFPSYVSEQQDIEHAVQMADRFNRIFMRTLRQLRDLRRYSPVTINNPSQVNIAADGGQQVNLSKN